MSVGGFIEVLVVAGSPHSVSGVVRASGKFAVA